MRNKDTVSIKGFGRDDGKIFRLTEMSASKKEAFSFKVLSIIDFKNPEVQKNFKREFKHFSIDGNVRQRD